MSKHSFRLTWSGIASLCALTLFVTGAARADAMRCGRELLPDDSSLPTTRKVCGPPTKETHRVEHRVHTELGKHGGVTTYQYDVVIDVLLYDFGPNEFVYTLSFENEKMIRMERGSWGAPR